MQTEQELLKEIARVAGLINRKKNEASQPPKPVAATHPTPRPYSNSYNGQKKSQTPAPPRTGQNMSYVRPGVAQQTPKQISQSNPSNPPLPQTSTANANRTSKNNNTSSNPQEVTPILKFSKVITPTSKPMTGYQRILLKIKQAQMRKMKRFATARPRSSMSLVVKDGVSYKKSHNKLMRIDENPSNDSDNNNEKKELKKKTSWRRNSLKGLLNIGDESYKKTRTKLIRFTKDTDEPKKLVVKSPLKRRISLSGRDYARKTSSLRLLPKKRNKKSSQLCLFYTKFGKCNQGDNCPFTHDPNKVATCRNFLKGKCNDPNCLLRHKIDRDQMPVCYHFLKGICTNENCPYSHVKVNRNAEVCPDFLKGYCPRGSSCKLKHSDTCDEFLETGSCKNGDKCKLRHVRKSKRKADQLSGEEESNAENINSINENKMDDRPVKRIRPNFE